MRQAYKRDKHKRNLIVKFEAKRRLIKSIKENKRCEKKITFFFLFKSSRFLFNCNTTKAHNFCHVTFKSHSVFRFFGLERGCLRDKIMNGDLNYILYRIHS